MPLGAGPKPRDPWTWGSGSRPKVPRNVLMANLDPTAPAQIGEHDVATHLDAIEGVASVHDRAIPGSRAVIDHIVIGPSGVYVIDTNTHRGSVERRDNRLIVDERDRTDLAIAMSHRVGAVSAALSDLRLPISRRCASSAASGRRRCSRSCCAAYGSDFRSSSTGWCRSRGCSSRATSRPRSNCSRRSCGRSADPADPPRAGALR